MKNLFAILSEDVKYVAKKKIGRKLTQFGFLVSLLFALLLIGCASIPKGSSYVSLKVTEGIQRIQTENEKIIKALADTERAILDEKWDDIYAKTEKKYMEKYKISDPSQFTHDDRRKIAANAALARETILKEIAKKENELIEKSRSNSDTVIMMNDEVVRYLNSLENIKETRNRINNMFDKFTGIDISNLQGTVIREMNILDEKIKQAGGE